MAARIRQACEQLGSAGTHGGEHAGQPLTELDSANDSANWRNRTLRVSLVSMRRGHVSALAFSASNSCCVIVPESSSALALAISSAEPPAASRTRSSNALF